MIPKQEILQTTTDTNLSAQVIEKDYVLGWILAGINRHAALSESWVFKGGTCLKKCYFDTYRFSEDLDFTLKNSSHLDDNFLEDAFTEISEWIYEQSGIELPVDRMIFDRYKAGSCQGRIFYRGPVAPTSPKQIPRIKLDLTVQELIVDPPVLNRVNHNYSDCPENGIHIQCYSYTEVFAEKIRALAERTRPRDLYDVINFYRRPESTSLATEISRVLQKKCDFKNIPIPDYESLLQQREACLAGWDDQLAHQLQTLPPFESFWDELQPFFNWLAHPEIITRPLSDIPSQQSTIENIAPQDIWPSSRSSLDKIRFAAANHLCVELRYTREDGQHRTYIIEPYSLRKSTDGHLLIYGLKHPKKEIRTFRIDRILEAKATSQSFTPSYRVEFLPTGPLLHKI